MGPCFPQQRIVPVLFTPQVETVPASTWLHVWPGGTLESTESRVTAEIEAVSMSCYNNQVASISEG